jgi:transaldolase
MDKSFDIAQDKPESALFIDGADPAETLAANNLLKSKKPDWNVGIGGQTTNPSLVSKNPEIIKYLASGKKLTREEALKSYRTIVENIAKVTTGPVSIQVIADESTPLEDMLSQGRIYKTWIPNGVVKFPATYNGLAAAEIFVAEFPVNITLNFSQSQAAAVYSATINAKYPVFVSPFVGRLDDRGENGMDIVHSELKMYEAGDGHVKVLTASLRTMEHLMYALFLKSPAITIPFKIFKDWADTGFQLPQGDFKYQKAELKSIPYQEFVLGDDWKKFDLSHDLTTAGLKKFMEDWNSIVSV